MTFFITKHTLYVFKVEEIYNNKKCSKVSVKNSHVKIISKLIFKLIVWVLVNFYEL